MSDERFWPPEFRTEPEQNEEAWISTPERFRKKSGGGSPPQENTEKKTNDLRGSAPMKLIGCLVFFIVAVIILAVMSVFFWQGVGWVMENLPSPPEQQTLIMDEAPDAPPVRELETQPVFVPPPVVMAPAPTPVLAETLWMEAPVTRDSTRVERRSDERVVISFPGGDSLVVSADLGYILDEVVVEEEQVAEE